MGFWEYADVRGLSMVGKHEYHEDPKYFVCRVCNWHNLEAVAQAERWNE